MKNIINALCAFVCFVSASVYAKGYSVTLIDDWVCGEAKLSSSYYSSKIKENKQYGNMNLFLTINNNRTVEIQLESDWIYSMECVTAKDGYIVLHQYMPGNISDTLFSVVNLKNGMTEVEFPTDLRHGDSSKAVFEITGVPASNARCVKVNDSDKTNHGNSVCFADPDLAKIYESSKLN